MTNPRELKKRKQELISHLEQAKNYKAQTIKFLNNLQNKLNNNEIKESEFRYKLIQALKGKTPEEWVSYYNKLIKEYNDELILINNKLGETQEKSFNANTVLIVLFFLILSFTGIILIKPQITGLVIYQQGEIINDNLTLNLPSNITINESIVLVKLNSQESQLPLSNFNIVENLVTIELSKFNIVAENGNLNAQIIFNNSVVSETSLLIELQQQVIQPPIENIIQPFQNITNQTLIISLQLNITKTELKSLKKDFKTNEIPEFDLNYNINIPKGARGISAASNEQVEAAVYKGDYVGIGIETKITKVQDGLYKISLVKNRQFKAGNYKLVVSITSGEDVITQEQDFTWGVLVLNLDKSIYLENENSFISIGILDENGKIICDADVTLEITDPSGRLTKLKTSDNTIKISPECSKLGATELPDYYANYQVNNEGTYNVNLTAVTNNGIKSIDDQIIVQKNVDFDVSRNGATRIYPPVDYVMNIKVKANQDYNGLIKEFVPDSFEIKNTNANIQENAVNKERILNWNVKLKQNDIIELNYTYNAPDTSPEIFLLGPLEINNFKETRQWQLASDANNPTQTRFNFMQNNASDFGINYNGRVAQNITFTNVTTHNVRTQPIAIGTVSSHASYFPGLSNAGQGSSTGNGTFFTPNFSIPTGGFQAINGTWSVSILGTCSANAATARVQFIVFKLNRSDDGKYWEWNLTGTQNAAHAFTGAVNASLLDACAASAGSTKVSQNLTVRIPAQFNTGFTNLTGNDRIGVRIAILQNSATAANYNISMNNTGSFVNITNVTFEAPSNPFFTFGPQINSTNGLNQTGRNLTVIWIAQDNNTKDNTLRYNITWYMNNITNMTLNNSYYISNRLNVDVLIKNNLTKGVTWRAKVDVFDNVTNTSATTSEILILNTPPAFQVNTSINSTAGLNLTITNLNVFFTPNETDVADLANLNYSIQVYTNNVTNFTIFRIGTTNGTFTNFVVNSKNLTKGQTWKAQVWVGDGTENSTYVNTSELLILNSNATITAPTFNQSSYVDTDYLNVSLVFSDNNNDLNNVTFEWYRTVGASPGLIQRTTNLNLANGTNTSDTLSPTLTSASDQIIVQAFAFDGTQNSTLLNSTTITIPSGNAAPNNPFNLTINSTVTAQTNLTTEDLRMNFWCDDPDVADTLTFHLTAFKNNTNQFQLQGGCNDPEYKSVVLTSPNNTKGYVWSFNVNISDAAGAYSGYNSTLVNLTILNSPPIIGNVTLDEANPISVIEAGNKTFRFSFVATDPDNFTDIVNLSTVANISRTGEAIRYNDTFVNSNDGGCNAVNNVGTNGKNFSCTINVVFYDGAGVWNLSVRINDTTGVFAQNITKNFTISELTALTISPASISFPTVAIGSFNTSSLANLTILNTGNDDISGRELTGETINISAITLVPNSGSTFIPASNFTIGQVNASGTFRGSFCDFSVNANVTRLQNKTNAAGFSNFTGAINGSAVLANANNNAHTLGICLIHVPNDLSLGQNYSTVNSGAWTISIFFFKRRKNKLYDKNKGIINSIIEVKITNKLNNKEIMNLINYEELMLVPISIFKDNSPLEALVKYLKENLNLSLNEIASLINRDPRTIWITYSNSKKSIKKLDIDDKKLVPLNIFNNRKLSILENLVYYLQNKEISLNNIAEILNRNYKTIYTVYSRVKNKNSNVYK